MLRHVRLPAQLLTSYIPASACTMYPTSWDRRGPSVKTVIRGQTSVAHFVLTFQMPRVLRAHALRELRDTLDRVGPTAPHDGLAMRNVRFRRKLPRPRYIFDGNTGQKPASGHRKVDPDPGHLFFMVWNLRIMLRNFVSTSANSFELTMLISSMISQRHWSTRSAMLLCFAVSAPWTPVQLMPQE